MKKTGLVLALATVFIVAQRISTIMHADRIIVLEKGQIVLDGTPKEVFSHDVTVYGLTLPPATETANRLVDKGFAFDTTITNEDELVEGVCKQLR